VSPSCGYLEGAAQARLALEFREIALLLLHRYSLAVLVLEA
jgi:hypothetical protein